MNRLAIFDCDGTLVDSQADICLAMEHCFAGAGLPPPPRARTRRVVGLSLVEAMRAMAPEAEDAVHRALAEAYKTAFQRLRGQGLVEEPLYDGVAELLDRLEADGWLLGVATGKSDRGLALCLERHGLARRFVTLQTADRHPSKPHPSMIEAALAETGADPELSMMIGDTSYDMAMAKAAGVRAVGVAWGYHEAEELVAAGADCVARRPAEIAALAEAMA
ncbi:MAG: HAD-IA family hydrolase [Alphaproteobacteria bacterium]|nr:HAD-IA family hydrolase [Alphaproteobacteria bacterium]